MAQFKKGDIIIPKNKKSTSAGYTLRSIGELKVLDPKYSKYRNRNRIKVLLISPEAYSIHQDEWRGHTQGKTLIMYEDSFKLLKPKVEPLYNIF